MYSLVAAMARTIWTIFWLVLVVWGTVLVIVGGVGDEDRVVDLGEGAAGEADGAAAGSVGGGMGVGVGGIGERVLALGGETEDTAMSSTDGVVGEGAGDTSTPHVVEVGESSRPGGDDTPITEQGQASNGGDTEDTFRDLLELSGGERTARLCQTTLLEAFASSSRMGQPDVQMDEATEGDDDPDEEFVADGEQAEADDDEEGAEEGEPAMQGHRPAKRRRHLPGVGAFGWNTLLGGGPLEGYRCRPSAMLRFRTIAAQQVY